MKFVLVIEMGNAAMRTRFHIVDALREAAKKLEKLPTGQVLDDDLSIHDVNGNRVGTFGFKTE